MTSGAENSNLLAEFEEAFKETMSTLTQEDTMFDRSPETLQHELENKVLRFTEIARQLETFFSQKRYVIRDELGGTPPNFVYKAQNCYFLFFKS